MALLNKTIPTAAPMPSGMMKGKFFFTFFRLSVSMRRSYIFRITAMVPPLTPGIMLATPTIAPKITNLTMSIPSLSQTSF